MVLSPHRAEALLEWYEETPHVTLVWELLARFDDSTVKDEGSVLYRVRRSEAPSPSEDTPLSANRIAD